MTTPALPSLRIAVIGHVEHAVIGRLPRLPRDGDIAHLDEHEWIPGGGGGIAFSQLANGPGDIHFYTALGSDDAATAIATRLAATGAHIHAARREEPQTRDVIIVTPDGQRTILVVGEPLHALRADPLPWEILASCDAAYFTGQDADALVAARQARVLVVTARRQEALARSGVRADVVVGSRNDPREVSTLRDYLVPPGALVMTEGSRGGYVETVGGIARFAAAPAPDPVRGSYGAGDTFAGALTWYVARGLGVVEACERAAVHGAAVLRGVNPLAHQLVLEA